MWGEGATGHRAQVPPGAGGGQEGTPRPPGVPEDPVLQTPRFWSPTSDLERTQVLPQPLIWGAQPPGEAGEEVGTVLFAPPHPHPIRAGGGRSTHPPGLGCVTGRRWIWGGLNCVVWVCPDCENSASGHVDFTLQKNQG